MAGDLKAQISITADASGVQAGVTKAKRSLADLGSSAANAGKQASDGLSKAGDGGQNAATKVDSATKNIIGSIERATAALNAGGRATSDYYKTLASQRGVNTDTLKPFLDQLDAANVKAKEAGHGMEEFGFGTASAKRELLVLTHELSQGNFKKFGGSLLVLAEQTGAAGLLFNPLTLAIVGVTAVAAGLSEVFIKGAAQSKAFADALVLTGNAAGLTEANFNSLIETSAKAANSTVGNTREIAQALLSTGQIGPEVFGKATTAAVGYAKATGQTADKVAESFAKMTEDPAKFALEINKSFNIFTSAQYAAIVAMQENGKAADAQGIIFDALNQRFPKLDENLGTLQTALHSGAQLWSSFWDAALAIGRKETPEDKIKKLKAELAQAPQDDTGAFLGGSGADQKKRDQLAALEAQVATNNASASAAAAQASINKAGIDAKGFVDGYLKRAKSVELLNQTLDEARRKFDAAAKAGTPVSAVNQKLVLDKIREDFAPKKSANPALGIDKAQLSADLEVLKKQSAQFVDIYQNQEKALEASHAAGTISDNEFYAKRRENLDVEDSAEEFLLNQQIRRAQAEKLSGKDAIENQKRIADLQAQLTKVREDASARLSAINEQEQAGINKLAAAYLAARQAAQDYYDGIQRQQNRQLAGVGQGNQARELTSGINQIEDRYTSQKRDLENRRALLEAQTDTNGNSKFNADAKKQYDNDLSLIQEFQAKSIASYTEYYAKLREMDKSYSLGATEALNNYKNDSQNVYKATEKIVTDSFQGMEDALTTFVTSGKLSFKSLADSIAADIARLAIKQSITGPLAGFASNLIGGTGAAGAGSGGLGGLLGSLAGLFGASSGVTAGANAGSSVAITELDDVLGGLAIGGTASAGSLVRVNEKGPELLSMAGKQYLMPMADGQVTPMGTQSSGTRPVTVNLVQNFAQGTSKQTTDQAAAQAAMHLKRSQRVT